MSFLLFLLAITAVTQSVDTLHIDQTLTCQIQVPPGADYKGFLEDVKSSELSSFSIVSSSFQMPSTLTFVLQPTRTGECVFAPGFITILPGKKQELLPAVQAQVVTTGISTLNFLPPLPLYPEKKIGLSVENRLRLLSPEVVQNTVFETAAELMRHRYAWEVLVGALITITGSILCMWALVEYEIARRAKIWLVPKKDPAKELWEHVRDKNVDIISRWESLVMLIKMLNQNELSEEQKKVLDRAEIILYAKSATTEDELLNYIKQAHLGFG